MVVKTKGVVSKLPVNQILSAIIENGLELSANFIHLEPINDLVRVKYRVDGSLINGIEISKKRFDSLSDKELGFWGKGLDTLNRALELSSGLILVTGPSDSGKSKTMATLLESINDHSISISTLEDPVEYKISRATQTQINHRTNLNFRNGIKILLKQDNDVIMLSELTDPEAIVEALDIVSHKKLVVSSLNIDSAVETITKLLDYNISPASLTYALRIVINQRLVKRLCPNCKQYIAVDKDSLGKINGLFALNNPTNIRYIHNLEVEYYQSRDNKKISSKALSTSETRLKRIWTNNLSGCPSCHNTGFSGRIAVVEILKNSPEIERLIITKSKDILINKQAVKEGMINYLIDGLLKVLVGETTIDEIIKLTKSSYLA